MKTNVLLLFKASFLLASCSTYVSINGVKWDKTNTVIDGEEFFTFDQAQQAAASVGKRLPTQAEFRALDSLGSTWDDELKGRWFGKNHQRKKKSGKTIFLPAAGALQQDGTAVWQTENGVYRTSEVWAEDFGYVLFFSEDRTYSSASVNAIDSYTVRCVRDKSNRKQQSSTEHDTQN